ncbi:MAG: LppP/LprE family lipoprotein [Solirubrobacterales bacterium]|nr:LppP/LprE family lipoprotein [Solirubrobacterales bacterium]
MTAIVAFAGCGASPASKSASTQPATGISITDQPSTATTSTRPITTPADPLAWATSVLKSQGYAPVNADQYSASRELRILVGKKAGEANMRVFFFIGDGRWLGTDTTTPSGQVTVAHQGDNTAQVTYSLYRPGDADRNPTGGTKTVTFKWNGTKLIPLDQIPSADPKAALSRR